MSIEDIKQNTLQAEEMIQALRNQLQLIKASQAKQYLLEENQKLTQIVSDLKGKLIRVEEKLGVKQVAIQHKPSAPVVKADRESLQHPTSDKSDAPPAKQSKPAAANKKEKKTAEKPAKNKSQPKPGNAADAAAPVDVSRLNMKIGTIVGVKKHPDADTLYVEEVDVGEPQTRTVVSGLVKHVPIEQMENRVAIFMCNLKPAKMRGILSQAMIMCASTPEKVEIIVPPANAANGDRVIVPGFEGTPDAQLNPKKKIFEQIQPDLLINSDGVPTYKGVAWNVAGKGTCSVPTMRGCGIK